MLSQLSAESLIKRHGRTTAGRRKARAELIEHMRAAAEREIARAGKSINCQEGRHRRTFDGYAVGCQNASGTCLCDCHDGQWDSEVAKRANS